MGRFISNFVHFYDLKPKLPSLHLRILEVRSRYLLLLCMHHYSTEKEKSKDRKPETDGPSPHAVWTNNNATPALHHPCVFCPPAGVKDPLAPSNPPRGPILTIRKCEAQVKSCGQIRGFKSPNWVFMNQWGIVNPSSLGLCSSLFPGICLCVKLVFSTVC